MLERPRGLSCKSHLSGLEKKEKRLTYASSFDCRTEKERGKKRMMGKVRDRIDKEKERNHVQTELKQVNKYI